MAEIDIIVNELKSKVSTLEAEKKELVTKNEEIKNKISIENKNMITRKSAAEEVYNRLKKVKMIGLIALITPPLAAIVTQVNFMAGAAIGFFSAAGASIIYKREIVSEIQRIKEKYSLK
jgi:hypothetical protein